MPLDLGGASRSGCRMSQFTSFAFLLFVVPVWALYRLLPHRGQNILLLVASYVFYASWDWRFGGLILLSTVVDYISGRLLGRDLDSRVRRLRCPSSIATVSRLARNAIASRHWPGGRRSFTTWRICSASTPTSSSPTASTLRGKGFRSTALTSGPSSSSC